MASNSDFVQFIVDQCSDAGEAVLDEVVLRPPYPSARDHFYITNVDDRDYLEDIIRATLPELMSGKSKAKRSAVNRQVPSSLDEAIAPNILSALRFLGAVSLLFCNPAGAAFWVIYGLCGVSDMADGYLAPIIWTISAKIGQKLRRWSKDRDISALRKENLMYLYAVNHN